jgi:hypothetical protein
MFVERKVRHSTLFTNLVRWHTCAVSFPLSDVILALLASPPPSVAMFCLHSGITNPSLYEHWVYPKWTYLNNSSNATQHNDTVYKDAQHNHVQHNNAYNATLSIINAQHYDNDNQYRVFLCGNIQAFYA